MAMEARRRIHVRPANTTGGVTSWPPALQPIAVQEFLVYWTTATGGYLVKKPPAPDARLVSEMRIYVRRYGIGTVVVDSSWPDAETVVSVLRRALGDPVSAGGVDLWLNAWARATERVHLVQYPGRRGQPGRVRDVMQS